MALQWGTDTSISITAGSLASAANRSSAAVTTSTTANVTAVKVKVSVLTTATAPSGNKQVIVYAYKSEDGSTYTGNSSTTDNVDGTDKALTAIGSPTALIHLGVIPLNQGAVAVTAVGVFDLPSIDPKWGIVLYNDAGTALGATVSASYREQYYN